MMRPFLLMLMLWSTTGDLARAGDILPGLWELTLETSVTVTPDLVIPATTIRQCLTDQDAQDPSRVLGKVANPGASDCVFSEKSDEGGTLRFKMQCAGTLGVRTQGDVTYTETSIEGSLVTSADLMGQTTELQSKIRARRLEDCKHEPD